MDRFFTMMGTYPGPPFVRFSVVIGPCESKEIFLHPPSSPGNTAGSLLRSLQKGNSTHARRCGTDQTTDFAAGVLTAAQLDRLPRQRARRVRGTLPFAPGHPALVLCQCPQESVLLSRLSAWRGPNSL